jgi:quercetin dioxygenase-like cupin family protein
MMIKCYTLSTKVKNERRIIMPDYQVGKASEIGYVGMLDGIERKTLVYGDNSLLTEFRLAKGKTLPNHKHSQEQTGYLVSGHITLIIDGERHDMKPGDSWSIKGNVEHSAEIIIDSIALEVFSPVREDYL